MTNKIEQLILKEKEIIRRYDVIIAEIKKRRRVVKRRLKINKKIAAAMKRRDRKNIKHYLLKIGRR